MDLEDQAWFNITVAFPIAIFVVVLWCTVR